MSIKVDEGTQTYNFVTLEEMKFPFWTKKSLYCAKCSYAWLLSVQGPILLYKFNDSRLCFSCRHLKEEQHELKKKDPETLAATWCNDFVNIEHFRCCNCGENANMNHKFVDKNYGRIPMKTNASFTKHRYCIPCYEFRESIGRLDLVQCDWDDCKRFNRNSNRRKRNPI